MIRAARPGTPPGAIAGHLLPRMVIDLFSYGLVSLAALGCDYGLLILLAGQGVHYLAAQAISFCAGMAIAYALSVRFVFASRRGLPRSHEALAFFAVGLAGLVLTQVLLALFVSGLGIALALAKIPVSGCVFLFNFLARRGLVFAKAGGVSR